VRDGAPRKGILVGGEAGSPNHRRLTRQGADIPEAYPARAAPHFPPGGIAALFLVINPSRQWSLAGRIAAWPKGCPASVHYDSVDKSGIDLRYGRIFISSLGPEKWPRAVTGECSSTPM